MRGGQISGIEAVRTAFDSSDTEAVLLVEATNELNSLNRQVALQGSVHHSQLYLSTHTELLQNCL